MLQFLKKLKLRKSGSRKNIRKSIHVKIYLWSFFDYHYLQKYLYNWNIKLNYYFICKINIKGYFTWKLSR